MLATPFATGGHHSQRRQGQLGERSEQRFGAWSIFGKIQLKLRSSYPNERPVDHAHQIQQVNSSLIFAQPAPDGEFFRIDLAQNQVNGFKVTHRLRQLVHRCKINLLSIGQK